MRLLLIFYIVLTVNHVRFLRNLVMMYYSAEVFHYLVWDFATDSKMVL